MPRMTEPWHKDANGDVRPTEYVGKRYFHPKTGHLYEVINYGIDAQRELWLLAYSRVVDDERDAGFTYYHTIADFTREGRFLEVKQ